MFDFLLEQAAKGRFFLGVALVWVFVVSAFLAYQKHGRKGVLKLLVASWCALFLLYMSVMGIGHTWGLTSYVLKALAIFVAVGIPLFTPAAFLAFGRGVAGRDWTDLVLGLSLGTGGVFVFPAAGLVLVCMFSGDCL